MIAVDDLQQTILSELMTLPVLEDYYLAGGTNLALRENHRKSIDLDLFVNKDFSIVQSNYINIKLKESFGSRYINTSVSNAGIFGGIDGVKVDLVNFPYDLSKPLEMIKNYRLASEIDIAAMKINAITGRGSKKDFYDIEKLLEKYSLEEIFMAYQSMFKIDNLLMAEKSLIYFNDADNSVLTNNKVVSLENKTWNQVKNNISLCFNNYNSKRKNKIDKDFSM